MDGAILICGGGEDSFDGVQLKDVLLQFKSFSK